MPLLLKYYQNELAFLVESGQAFARQYPELAKSLDFSSFTANDPDVQRLIESVAFLNARLQKRLDEQAPEISSEILKAIYPQFIAPIPSFAIMNFSYIAKPNNALKKIPRNTMLTTNKEFEKQYYNFKTTMDVEISPWEIENIILLRTTQANLPYDIYSICDNALQIRLNMLIQQPATNITFYIHMLDHVAYNVYEAVTSLFPEKNTPVFENGEQIGEIEVVGFDENESLFPHLSREDPSYRILLEYNVFCKKFLFFKVKLNKSPKVEIVIPFNSKKEIIIKKGDLLLNCTPAINLFEKTSEPIVINNKAIQYRISADNNSQHDIDIHTILSVEDTKFNDKRKYVPYFSCKHVLDTQNHYVFWLAKREQNKNENGYETSIALLDTKPNLDSSVLYAKLLCIQGSANVLIGPEESWNIANTPGNLQCINIDRPTESFMPALHSRTQWRLISHLKINHFGFNNNEGLEYIKELLAIYDFQSNSNRNAMHDLKELDYKIKMAPYNRSVVPKAQVLLKADDKQSSQVYLLAHILGIFFSKTLDFNTKIELVLKKQSNDSVWKRWNII